MILASCSDENPPTSVNDEYTEISLIGDSPYSINFKGPSGLAVDPDGTTLWSVSDVNRGGIYLLDLKGDVIGHIEMDSDDLEGIIMDPDNNTLWVVEEKLRELVNISKNGTELNRIKLNIEGNNENDGPEGITVNPETGHFYVVNEQKPRQLHELNPNMEIINTIDINFSGIFEVDDLSGISYNEAENNLWIVSGSSEKIVVIDLDGTPLRAYNIGVFDAEGIAVYAPERIVYVVSDTDKLFYIFNY